MSTTDTDLQQLVINVGTKAQIDAAISGGTITQDMLSVVTDSYSPAIRTVYDKNQAITSGSIALADDTIFYTDSPSASTTYTISTSGLTSASTMPYVYFNVLIEMPSTAVGIDFTTNNNVTWTEETTPDMTTGGRTYLLAFQSFDGGTSWIGSLATWWTTPTP